MTDHSMNVVFVCELCGQHLTHEDDVCNSGIHVGPGKWAVGRAIRSDALVAERDEALRLREVPILTFTDDETRELIRQRDEAWRERDSYKEGWQKYLYESSRADAAEFALAEARREYDELLDSGRIVRIRAVEESRDAVWRQVNEMETRVEAVEESNARLKAALEYIEGHLELCEEWEPGESLADENVHCAVRDSLSCARSALAAGTDA